MRYEYTGEELDIGNGRVLKRIRSLIHIDRFGVFPGTIGGFIESDMNLPRYTDCEAWVSGNAEVRDYAIVKDDALVTDDAIVHQHATVGGRSWVSGSAMVGGFARMEDNSYITGMAKLSQYAVASGRSTISGRASVTDSVRLNGLSIVSGDAIVIGAAIIDGAGRVTVNSDYLTIGPMKTTSEGRQLPTFITAHIDDRHGVRVNYAEGLSGSIGQFLRWIENEFDDPVTLSQYRAVYDLIVTTYCP